MQKNNSELSIQHNKVFIEQAPTAIAMLDKDMCYIAVSDQWISDYNMQGEKIIGRSHYEIFPEIGDEWKANHQKCLNGAVDICDEAEFRRADGSVQWIYWNVRPWYISENEIGGLLMHTGDITVAKERERERGRMAEILNKTNELARIGTWELNIEKNELVWSRVVHEILELPENYQLDLETGINFYKEGESRDTIKAALNNAMLHGTAFDKEVELITNKGNTIWVRAIGNAEIVNGKCIGLFGIFQDINEKKISQQALGQANAELEAIFNTKAVAIITTDKEGIINHFNQGAEILLGYSASEMIGLKKPDIYTKDDEFLRFTNDIAKKYHKDALGLNPLLEMAAQNEYDVREWTYKRKDGSTFPVQSTLSAIKNKQGELIGYLNVASDISERKQVENELLRKNQVLNFAEKLTMIGNWQWDTVNNNVTWSANLYKIFGLDEKETSLTYETYFSFVHPEDEDMVTEHVQLGLQEKNFPDLLHRIQLRNGAVKTIQLLAEVITNDAGEVLELVGTCQDVTEQRMAEIKFKGLLESAPDAMVIVNELGKIHLVNKQAEKLFGYSAQELVGESVEKLIPDGFSKKHAAHRAEFFANPKTREMGDGKELFGINKSGKLIPIQISLSPLKTEEGILVSSAIRDITTQKMAERKILEAKDRLEIFSNKLVAQNTQLADFSQITSHNLRAPVTNLNSLLGFYNQAENEEERVDLFEKFEKVIHHLTLTLNTLVEALKTKSENSKEAMEEVVFEEVMNKTKDILSGEILKTEAVIKCDFSKLSRISYNSIYLDSIFLNLIGNALKYKSPDRVPEIYIETGTENGKKILTVQDNGLGINLDRHGHKLFGLNKVFHRHPDAKGVGLFLTKMQIEAMGGSISAISEVNVGSTFKVNFN